RQALLEQVLRRLQVALAVGEVASPGERARLYVWRNVGGPKRQELRQPRTPFGVVSLHVPDMRQHYGHPQTSLSVAPLDCPEQCGSQIILLLQRVMRMPRMVHPWRLHVWRKAQTPVKMSLTQGVYFTAFAQPFPGILSDRLQKAKAHLL